MHDQAYALGYESIDSCPECVNRERDSCRAPKLDEAATYLLLIGDRDRASALRVALRRRGRSVTQHSARDARRARRLLGSLQYDAIALFWDEAITADALQELSSIAGNTQRVLFSRGAPAALVEQAEATGWMVCGSRSPVDARSVIEDILDAASRTVQSAGAPHYDIPGFDHIDLRPVVRVLAESRGLTPTEAMVLASKLACWSMEKRQTDLGCSRRLIERYEGELREDLGLREVILWLIAGLDILARDGKLSLVGFGHGHK